MTQDLRQANSKVVDADPLTLLLTLQREMAMIKH